MKNITLSADGDLIDGARRRAAAENTTLNQVFREWLAAYAAAPRRLTLEELRQSSATVSHFRAGQRFTRDERNER